MSKSSDRSSDNPSREEFSRILAELVRSAREKGGITSEEEVRSAFKAFELDEGRLESVYAYLRENNIGIGEALDPGEYLTNEEHRYLDDYLAEIGELPGLSAEDKERLIDAACKGDEDAAGTLITGYLRHVADVARLYAEQGVYLEDLIGEGNVALTGYVGCLGIDSLLKEGNNAPEEKEASLTDRFEKELTRAVMDAMENLVTENLAEDGRGVEAVKIVQEVADKARELSQELRRSVTIEELMEETGWERDHILNAIKLCGDQIEDINTTGIDIYDRKTREAAEQLYEMAKGRLFNGDQKPRR